MNELEKFSAIAHPNIAFIKYWGNFDHDLRLPSNGSISMNLASLETYTSLVPDPTLNKDLFILNNISQSGPALTRVHSFMDHLRRLGQKDFFFHIYSNNNFPASAGLASSSAAFAALAVAGTKAFNLDLPERDLSRLARCGSGSAARSIPEGFVEWIPGMTDHDSYAFSIASADYWQLSDCIAIVEETAKETGSTQGHRLAETSPLQNARVTDAPRRLDICRNAIKNKDFDALAYIIELDSQMLHAVMMTSFPSLIYWNETSLSIMKAVPTWRQTGIPCAYTLDAGPNVHIICPSSDLKIISEKLEEFPAVKKVLVSSVGQGARLIP